MQTHQHVALIFAVSELTVVLRGRMSVLILSQDQMCTFPSWCKTTENTTNNKPVFSLNINKQSKHQGPVPVSFLKVRAIYSMDSPDEDCAESISTSPSFHFAHPASPAAPVTEKFFLPEVWESEHWRDLRLTHNDAFLLKP